MLLFSCFLILTITLKFNENLRKKFFAYYYSFNLGFHDEFDNFKYSIIENYNFDKKEGLVSKRFFIISYKLIIINFFFL